MPTRSLTDRQEQVLRVIITQTVEQGCPPTIREIAKAIGVRQTYAVQCHLAVLEEQGYVRLVPGKARGIILTSASQPLVLLKRLATAVKLEARLTNATTIAPVLKDVITFLRRAEPPR